MTIKEIRSLLLELKGQIHEDYRASEEDTLPSMQVTVSTTDGQSWSYQTGYNGYTGGCYVHSHWSLIYLYRNSNCRELARDAVNELLGMVEEEK